MCYIYILSSVRLLLNVNLIQNDGKQCIATPFEYKVKEANKPLFSIRGDMYTQKQTPTHICTHQQSM